MDVITLGKKVQSEINTRGRLFFSRRQAHLARKKIIEYRNKKVVDRKLKSSIKSYSEKVFGDSSYWPWLGLYTEIRGEFITGWLPDDYYNVILLDKYCPKDARISNYKTFDYSLFPDFAVKPVMVKISGQYYDPDKNPLSIHEAQEILNGYNGELVVKQDSRLGGSSVEFIESSKIELSTFQEVPNFTIQPVIKQHKILKKLNHKAVSTIRVVTFLKESGDIEIKYTYLRFGVGDSRVDNTSADGGFCYVNTNGDLDEKAFNKLGLELGTKHPDTGVRFRDIKVPNYDLILENCIQSHKSYPYVRIVGWDVTIDEEGNAVLLEWNADPGIWEFEALYGPRWEGHFV